MRLSKFGVGFVAAKAWSVLTGRGGSLLQGDERTLDDPTLSAASIALASAHAEARTSPIEESDHVHDDEGGACGTGCETGEAKPAFTTLTVRRRP